VAERGVIISPPPPGSEARAWWDKGAAAEHACEIEGLPKATLEVRE
jgi:hypothetical protein